MAKQMIAVWAPSGTGKTSLLASFLTGLHRATGKRGRLYNVDGGVDSIKHLEAAGALDIFEMGNQAYPFEAMLDVSRGYWPRDPKDALSQLESPMLVRYIAECTVCNKRVYDQDKACVTTHVVCTCKASIPVRPRNVWNPANDLSKNNVGVLMYEGGTGFGEKMMDNMSDRSAKGEKIGEDIAVRFKDGGLDIGGVSRSAYGIAQRRVKRAVEYSRMVPGVDYVIWTFHKARGEDDVKRSPVFGPKIVGSAATDDVPRWFGPCLSLTSAPNGKDSERRVYMTNYFETWNQVTASVECLANSRIPVSVLDGVPPYFVFDKSKKGEFGAETILYDIVQLIERKQAEAAKLALAGKKSEAFSGLVGRYRRLTDGGDKPDMNLSPHSRCNCNRD